MAYKNMVDVDSISIEEMLIKASGSQIAMGCVETCAVVNEHLTDDAGLRNSWVMFLVRVDAGAQEGRDVNWVRVEDLDGIRIIPSDAWMLRELASDRMKLHHVKMRELEQYVHAFTE